MTELEILKLGMTVVGAVFVGYSVIDNLMDWIKKKANSD